MKKLEVVGKILHSVNIVCFSSSRTEPRVKGMAQFFRKFEHGTRVKITIEEISKEEYAKRRYGK